MARVHPTEARFPSVPGGAGHYESFYLKACDPERPLGAWIRYTVHKRPGAAPTGSLWFTLFGPDGPRAAKVTVPGPGGFRVRGRVAAARKDVVGWVYADPDGSEHHTANCSIADMRLSVERDGAAPVELVVEGGAAYELGMRERDHGIPIQPFPDG